MLKKGQVTELRKLLQNRSSNTKMANKEFEATTMEVRGLWNEYNVMIWLDAIKKEGYGNERLNRVMDRFELKHDCLQQGYVGLKEYEELMRKIDGIEVDTEWVRGEAYWEYNERN